jgi:hypothetical protein
MQITKCHIITFSSDVTVLEYSVKIVPQAIAPVKEREEQNKSWENPFA